MARPNAGPRSGFSLWPGHFSPQVWRAVARRRRRADHLPPSGGRGRRGRGSRGRGLAARVVGAPLGPLRRRGQRLGRDAPGPGRGNAGRRDLRFHGCRSGPAPSATARRRCGCRFRALPASRRAAPRRWNASRESRSIRCARRSTGCSFAPKRAAAGRPSSSIATECSSTWCRTSVTRTKCVSCPAPGRPCGGSPRPACRSWW